MRGHRLRETAVFYLTTKKESKEQKQTETTDTDTELELELGYTSCQC